MILTRYLQVSDCCKFLEYIYRKQDDDPDQEERRDALCNELPGIFVFFCSVEILIQKRLYRRPKDLRYIVSFSWCAIEETGDNYEISAPEYQVYPICLICREIYSSQSVFLQVFEEDLHAASATCLGSIQGLPESTLSGIHRWCRRDGGRSGDTWSYFSTPFHNPPKISLPDKIPLSSAHVQENGEDVLFHWW
jgi:hypothetical protein